MSKASLQSALQVECQQVLSDFESLKTELVPEKHSQVLGLEESNCNVAVKTEVQEFFSVVERIEAVKNELNVKVTHEPVLNEIVEQEVQQVLQVTEDIISLKEEVKAKVDEEPNVKVELPDIKHVLSISEELKHLNDLQKEKLQEHPEILKDIQTILCLADSLENIEIFPSGNIPQESDKIMETKLPTAEIKNTDLSSTDVQSKISGSEPVLLQIADKQVLEMSNAFEDVLNSINTFEAKLTSNPAVNFAIQQESQEILSAVNDIKAIKHIVQTATNQEQSLKIASQVEMQQVLLTCNIFERLKESVEANLTKELKIYSSVESELQQILSATSSLLTIKQMMADNTIKLEPINVTDSVHLQKVIPDESENKKGIRGEEKTETGKNVRDDELNKAQNLDSDEKNKELHESSVITEKDKITQKKTIQEGTNGEKQGDIIKDNTTKREILLDKSEGEVELKEQVNIKTDTKHLEQTKIEEDKKVNADIKMSAEVNLPDLQNSEQLKAEEEQKSKDKETKHCLEKPDNVEKHYGEESKEEIKKGIREIENISNAKEGSISDTRSANKEVETVVIEDLVTKKKVEKENQIIKIIETKDQKEEYFGIENEKGDNARVKDKGELKVDGGIKTDPHKSENEGQVKIKPHPKELDKDKQTEVLERKDADKKESRDSENAVTKPTEAKKLGLDNYSVSKETENIDSHSLTEKGYVGKNDLSNSKEIREIKLEEKTESSKKSEVVSTKTIELQEKCEIKQPEQRKTNEEKQIKKKENIELQLEESLEDKKKMDLERKEPVDKEIVKKESIVIESNVEERTVLDLSLVSKEKEKIDVTSMEKEEVMEHDISKANKTKGLKLVAKTEDSKEKGIKSEEETEEKIKDDTEQPEETKKLTEKEINEKQEIKLCSEDSIKKKEANDVEYKGKIEKVTGEGKNVLIEPNIEENSTLDASVVSKEDQADAELVLTKKEVTEKHDALDTNNIKEKKLEGKTEGKHKKSSIGAEKNEATIKDNEKVREDEKEEVALILEEAENKQIKKESKKEVKEEHDYSESNETKQVKLEEKSVGKEPEVIAAEKVDGAIDDKKELSDKKDFELKTKEIGETEKKDIKLEPKKEATGKDDILETKSTELVILEEKTEDIKKKKTAMVEKLEAISGANDKKEEVDFKTKETEEVGKPVVKVEPKKESREEHDTKELKEILLKNRTEVKTKKESTSNEKTEITIKDDKTRTDDKNEDKGLKSKETEIAEKKQSKEEYNIEAKEKHNDLEIQEKKLEENTKDEKEKGSMPKEKPEDALEDDKNILRNKTKDVEIKSKETGEEDKKQEKGETKKEAKGGHDEDKMKLYEKTEIKHKKKSISKEKSEITMKEDESEMDVKKEEINLKSKETEITEKKKEDQNKEAKEKFDELEIKKKELEEKTEYKKEKGSLPKENPEEILEDNKKTLSGKKEQVDIKMEETNEVEKKQEKEESKKEVEEKGDTEEIRKRKLEQKTEDKQSKGSIPKGKNEETLKDDKKTLSNETPELEFKAKETGEVKKKQEKEESKKEVEEKGDTQEIIKKRLEEKTDTKKKKGSVPKEKSEETLKDVKEILSDKKEEVEFKTKESEEIENKQCKEQPEKEAKVEHDLQEIKDKKLEDKTDIKKKRGSVPTEKSKEMLKDDEKTLSNENQEVEAKTKESVEVEKKQEKGESKKEVEEKGDTQEIRKRKPEEKTEVKKKKGSIPKEKSEEILKDDKKILNNEKPELEFKAKETKEVEKKQEVEELKKETEEDHDTQEIKEEKLEEKVEVKKKKGSIPKEKPKETFKDDNEMLSDKKEEAEFKTKVSEEIEKKEEKEQPKREAKGEHDIQEIKEKKLEGKTDIKKKKESIPKEKSEETLKDVKKTLSSENQEVEVKTKESVEVEKKHEKEESKKEVEEKRDTQEIRKKRLGEKTDIKKKKGSITKEKSEETLKDDKKTLSKENQEVDVKTKELDKKQEEAKKEVEEKSDTQEIRKMKLEEKTEVKIKKGSISKEKSEVAIKENKAGKDDQKEEIDLKSIETEITDKEQTKEDHNIEAKEKHDKSERKEITEKQLEEKSEKKKGSLSTGKTDVQLEDDKKLLTDKKEDLKPQGSDDVEKKQGKEEPKREAKDKHDALESKKMDQNRQKDKSEETLKVDQKRSDDKKEEVDVKPKENEGIEKKQTKEESKTENSMKDKKGLSIKTKITKDKMVHEDKALKDLESSKKIKNLDKSSPSKSTIIENQEADDKEKSSKKLKDKSVFYQSEVIQSHQIIMDSEAEGKLCAVEKEENKHKLYIDESSTSDYGSESYSEPHQIKKSQSYDTRQWVYDSEEVTTKTASRRVRERKYETSDLPEPEKHSYTRRQAVSKPVFCGRLVDRTAAQGSRLRVTCSLTGSPDPTVEWFKDGHPIDTNLDHRIRTRLSNGLASLEITEAKVGDSGKFTCTARNSQGEASTTANIKVFSYLESAPEAPVFTQNVHDHYKSTSDELVIECRVKGHPQPSVSWTKDGQSLRALSRYEQSVLTDGTCRLVIHGPEVADSGLYKCMAENAVWSEHTSAYVTFEGREKYLAQTRSLADPKLPRFTNILSDTTVREGGTVALQVAIKGIPRAEVTWYRGSERLPKRSSRFRYLEDASTGVYSLVMTEASTREAGTYTCRASNAYGYRDTSVNVEIVGSCGPSGPPRGKPAMFVSRPDTSMGIAVGEDVSFSFRVSGDPKPRVTWMKGMKDITSNIRTLKETVNDYVRLTLKHATVMDAGTYFIMAKNIYGADHAFVTVRVKQRARSLTPTRTTIWSGPDTSTILRDIHESTRALVNDVPGPISSEPVVSDCGKNWLSLSWGKPENRGAAPVLAYRVEAWLLGTEGGAQWSELGITPINSFDVFFLKPGSEYKFRITARNRYGWGESVTSTEPVSVGSAANFPPDIVRDLPGPLKALQGDNVTLECEISGDPPPTIQWLKDGQNVSMFATLTGRVFVSDDQLVHRLIVKQLTEDDSGRYVCEAINKLGRASTYARLLVVTDPRLLDADRKLKESLLEQQESAPQFTMRLRDRRVQASYPVRLTCQVIGSPTPSVTWTYQGQPVTDDARHQIVTEADHFHTLEVTQTLLEDSGEYTVTAQNCMGAVSCHCQLIVDKGIRAYVSPEFISELSPAVTMREGAELRLFAQVEAYPTVSISWQRDGVRLRPSRRLVMTLDPEGRVELALAHLTVRDAGLYTCSATNAVGRAETVCQVFVTGCTPVAAAVPAITKSNIPYSKEPRFVTKPRSSEAVEGDTVVITCEVVGDPQPEVMWLRDWLKPGYYRDAPQFHQIAGGSQYSLEIPQVKLDFTGTYCVIARNPHGEAKAIISLQIYAKGQGKEPSMVSGHVKHGQVETLPEIKRELRDLRCCDGDAVTLECLVSATPLPSVRWEKDGKILPLGEDIEAELDGETARLTIKKVYPEDEGQYSCVAYNNLGRAVTTACLVVDVPEEKETLLSQQLTRPPGLRSARSTPRSTPRNTPSPARSVSPTPARYREFSSPSFSRPKRIKMSSPKFYTVPHNRIAEEGETVRFQCSVAGHPTPWASWDKDGHIVTPSARLSVTERDDLRTLELREVTVEDAGLYRVTLENEMGSVEATARLDIIGRQGSRTRSVRAWSAVRSSPTFGRRLVGSAARVGGTFTLTCDVHASPSPVTSWYRNGEMLVKSPRVVPSWDGRRARLELRSLQPEDAGVYTCVAENSVGTTQCSAELRVLQTTDPSDADLQPPVFLQGLSPEQTAAEGQPFELQVRLQGSSPLEVVWVKDGVEVPDCPDLRHVDYGDGRFGLRIADVFVADGGIYNCEAFNDHGDAITSGHLIVNDMSGGESGSTEPEIMFTKTPSPVLARLRGQASFCARLQSHPLSHTSYTWTVNGRSVNNDDRFTVTTDEDCCILHVAEVCPSDLGPVVCTARVCSPGVPPTTVSCDTSLGLDPSPGVPAVLLRGPCDTTAMRGDRVLLKATYRGDPEPSVRWLKAGRELSSEGRVQITSRDGVSCLTISAIDADDSGKYVVSVENIHGADCHFASVAVEGPPEAPAARPSVTPAGEGCVTVAWSSPPYDGGCVITGYSVEMRTAVSQQWSVVADRCHSLSHVVRGLTPGQTYLFRVRAENIHGASESSADSFPFTLQSSNSGLREEEVEAEGDGESDAVLEPRLVTVEPGDQFLERYSVHEELGKGRYGVVHKVTDLRTGQTMAAKFVRCIKKQDREKVQEEIDIMNCLRHPKLLQLTAAFENPKDMVMVMEYISGGELFERVVADDFTLTERDCILFLRQICEGVRYMHSCNVVHLDLKPENIMCHTRTSHRVKIIDFGLAQKLETNTPVRVLFGTPEFIPPEIINYEPIGVETDMWSVGVICYVLLSGLSPFMGDNDAETFANITRADFDFDDEAFEAISQDAKDFISSLLVKRKEKRLTAEECLKHKWLTQSDTTMSSVKLCTDKLKKFIIRRKWQPLPRNERQIA